MHPNEPLNPFPGHDKQIRPKFHSFVRKIRSSKVVISCYPCFKVSENPPLKKVERSSSRCFTAFFSPNVFNFNNFNNR